VIARVVALHIYPVKSCRGVALPVAQVGPRGLAGDREWMIVDAHGRFLTQRTHPQLARVLAVPGSDGSLELGTAGSSPLHVPAPPDVPRTRIRVRVWDDEVDVLDAGDAAAQWLGGIAGAGVRLVHAGTFTARQPRGPWRGDAPSPVNFPDAYPILVCSVESLADLNARLAEPVTMARFRPNIVVEGLGAFGEDRVGDARIRGLRLRLVKACTRCSTTAVDQVRGVPSTNPLTALRAYRFDRELLGVTFGQNAIIVGGVGERIAVGDAFEAEEPGA
jgi:hypothetical protein